MAKLDLSGHSELAVMREDLNLRRNEWDLWPEQPDTVQVPITEDGQHRRLSYLHVVPS